MRQHMSIERFVIRGACAAGLLFAACGGDDSAGGSGTDTLVVHFELGNDRSCDALGVETIRAELNDKQIVQQAPCMNGQVRFRDLPTGTYHIKLFGLDEDGIEVMDSYTSSDTIVNVAGDDQTIDLKPAVTLTAAPAHLLVRWNFGFGTCKGVGIDRFVIKAWRGTGDNLILSQTMACSLEGEGKDQYRTIDDPDRRFGGDEWGEVSVQPFDKNDVEVGMAASFKFKAPGPGHDVKLSVNCEDDACTGSGKPD
jgi:hypothetical protein